MSRYSITLPLNHKECFNKSKDHMCPCIRHLASTFHCTATGCTGAIEDLMKSCPIEKAPEVPKKPVNYITCSDCGIQYHDHLVECPECGFIE